MNSTGNNDPKNKTSGAGNKEKSAENKKVKTSLKDHSNPLIRSIARVSYTVWLIVMAVGMSLAFIVALFLL